MPRAANVKDVLASTEKQIENLTDELAIRTAAITQGQSCSEILVYAEKEPEPFANDPKEATSGGASSNPWHKNPGGGGGCVVL